MVSSECFEAHCREWGWDIYPTDAYHMGMADFAMTLPPMSEENAQKIIDAISQIYMLG